jgi:hypothetical protein
LHRLQTFVFAAAKKSIDSCHVVHWSRAFKDAGDGHGVERGGK